MLSAFGLGAAHALEPGHGKTLVAAYLTGTRGKVSDAFILGIMVTIFHTLSVFLLGLGGVLLATTILKQDFFQGDLSRYMQAISGLIITSIGVMVLWRRFVRDKSPNECECHVHHVHYPEHSPDLSQAGDKKLNASTLKEVLTLGFACGISPCPIAITALMTSITVGGFGHLPQAFTYLVIFSIGLSSVLVLIGIALVLSSGGVSRWVISKNSKLPVVVSFLSTLIIITVGLYLTISPFVVSEEHAEEANALLSVFVGDHSAK
jgi:nickel/cobalt exporter